ncbi:MAG: hypothetical protein PHT33_05625 [bacterium]|nr:hypothetical protein [bacterium]
MNEQDLYSKKIRPWMQAQEAAGRLFWFKVHGAGYQRSGVPDLIISINSLFLAIELKSPEARGKDAEPTKAQSTCMASIRKAGRGITSVAQSLEEVQRIISEVEVLKHVQ